MAKACMSSPPPPPIIAACPLIFYSPTLSALHLTLFKGRACVGIYRICGCVFMELSYACGQFYVNHSVLKRAGYKDSEVINLKFLTSYFT